MRIPLTPGLCLILFLLSMVATAQDASLDTRVIQIPGTDTVVKIGTAGGAPFASLSRDGGETFLPLAAPRTHLNFHYSRFDPARDKPFVPGMLRSGTASRLFVVQFYTQALEEYRKGLQVLGVEIHHYLAYQAYLVRMSPATVAVVKALPYVRFVGRYELAYKLETEILERYLSGEEMAPQRYNLMMVDRLHDEADLVAAVESSGGKVNIPAHGNVLIEATLTGPQLLEVASGDTVLWVDRWSEIEEDIDNARIQGGANAIEFKKPESYVGKGMRGMIMEGIYATHPEFAAISPYRTAPLWIGSSSSASHGSNTCGEVFASGVQAKCRGLCPHGQIVYCNYNYVMNNNNRYGVVSTLVDLKQQYRGMFQTASWGYSRTTSYTSRSAEMDRIILDHDIPITQSQSNARDQMSRPQAWAKNIISVGGINHYDNADPNDDKWTSGSTGPAADGRIKPDMCAYYDKIYTTSGTTSYTSSFGGTSGATPIVCGHVALVLEMFTDGIFGHPMIAGGWQMRPENRSHFTTTKAQLINGAVPYPNGTRTTRYKQGWGFPNVQNIYDRRNITLVLDELDVLKNLESTDYYVFAPGGAHGDLRVTMTFADPETAPVTKIPHRINDLTLSVSGPSGLFWGNNGLATTLSTNYSTSGGSADTINTVENVFIQNPLPGIYHVRIVASEVNQDTHLETKAVDADFAMVVSGITGNRDRSGMVLGLTSASAGDLQLQLTTIPAAYTEGQVVYSLDTTRPLGMGHAFGLEPDLLTISTYFQPGVVGSPFHFLKTANPVFPNTIYKFDSAIASTLKGLTVDAVAFVSDGGGTILDFSNVARVTVK